MKKNRRILFYPACSTHVYTFELIKKHLENPEILAINIEPFRPIEKGLEESLRKFNYTYLSIDSLEVPSALFTFDPDVVVFGAGGEDPFTINLCFEAKMRNIPIIAIEEVNQLSLNQGLLNFYTLPFDHLAVASYEEKKMFEALNFPGNIIVTGLPQYEYLLNTAADIGINIPSKKNNTGKVLLYTTSPLQRYIKHSVETLESRINMLHLIKDGIPDDWQVIVKLHPRENKLKISLIIREILPKAIVVGREMLFEEVLYSADALISRGNSFTCLQALMKKVPVFIYKQGIKTMFDDNKSVVFINEPKELSSWLKKLDSYPKIEPLFIKKHFHDTGTSSAKAITDCIMTCKEYVDSTIAYFEAFKLAILNGQAKLANKIIKHLYKKQPNLALFELLEKISDQWENKKSINGKILFDLEKLISLDSSLYAWILRANVLQIRDYKDEAVEALKKAIQIYDRQNIYTLGWLYIRIVDLLLQQNKINDALNYLQEAQRIIPEWKEYNVLLGKIMLLNKNTEDAFKAINVSLELESSSSWTYNELGKLLFKIGKTKEAEAEFKEAIRLDPDNPWPHHDLGKLYAQTEKFDEAEAEFKEAIRLDPDNPWPHHDLGKLYAQTEKLDEAEAEFKEAIRCDPDNPWPHYELGELYLHKGAIDLAERELKAAIQSNSSVILPHYKLFLIYFKKGRIKGSITHFIKIIIKTAKKILKK